MLVLKHFLKDFLDKYVVDFLVSGFSQGLRLGCFNKDEVVSVSRHNKSAFQFKSGVDEAITKEVNRGHTLGLFSEIPIEQFHRSPIGADPKKDGSVRLVLDLSSPQGSLVNDRIYKDNYSVQ